MAIEVDVRFFASLRDEIGSSGGSMHVDGGSLDALLAAIERDFGEDARVAVSAENVRLAVNQTLAEPPLELSAGDEVAFLPPVTGG